MSRRPRGEGVRYLPDGTRRFAPGHTLSTRHGAHSPRMVDPIAAELVEEAVATCDYLREPHYQAEVLAWARAEARVILVTRFLDERGPLDPEGKPWPATELLVRLERLAAERRHALGLTPMARARLGRDVAGAQVDFAALMASIDREDRTP